jgi:hypothetical protein
VATVIRVEIQAEGEAEHVIAAFTTLTNSASERGWAVRVQDPSAIAAGSGRLAIDVSELEDESDARAAVQAHLDQIPNGGVFSIFNVEPA